MINKNKVSEMRLLIENFNNFLNEALDYEKARPILEKMFSEYHMVVKVNDNGNQYREILKEFDDNIGFTDNKTGYALLFFAPGHNNTWVLQMQLLSENKAIIKQIMNKLNEKWDQFSDTINKAIGHNTTVKDNTPLTQPDSQKVVSTTNVGSKGTNHINKLNIKSIKVAVDSKKNKHELWMGTALLT